MTLIYHILKILIPDRLNWILALMSKIVRMGVDPTQLFYDVLQLSTDKHQTIILDIHNQSTIIRFFCLLCSRTKGHDKNLFLGYDLFQRLKLLISIGGLETKLCLTCWKVCYRLTLLKKKNQFHSAPHRPSC